MLRQRFDDKVSQAAPGDEGNCPKEHSANLYIWPVYVQEINGGALDVWTPLILN